MTQKRNATPMSNIIQSSASMVIYGGKGECVFTVYEGAGAGIFVLGPCLKRVWVFAMAFKFGTCLNGRFWQTKAFNTNDNTNCAKMLLLMFGHACDKSRRVSAALLYCELCIMECLDQLYR